MMYLGAVGGPEDGEVADNLGYGHRACVLGVFVGCLLIGGGLYMKGTQSEPFYLFGRQRVFLFLYRPI